jgi:hypothetical protein
MTRIPSATVSTIVTTLLVALGAGAARADTVVQVPLLGLLDRRSVTTLMGQTLVVFNLATDGGGTDTGDGAQNGFATQAVAKLKGTPVANALPDDGRFPADARHPEVVLHVSNDADPTSGQDHLVPKTGGTFSFAMPPATYSKVFLFFHGANGGSTVKMTLTYSDATTEIANAMVPDYYADVSATDPVLFNLAPDLAKWTKTTTIAEANHHHITGVEIHPAAATKTLTTIQVDRGPTGYLAFWGATGVATSAVAGLPDGGADASSPDGGDIRPTDAGGGGGASATGGASGTGGGGTSGSGGASGGGAGGQTTGAAGKSAGAGGTNGAGSGGAAGATMTSGSAGSSGAAGSSARNGAGCGCRLGAAPRTTHTLWLVLGAVSTWCLGRRRRRAPLRRR